jgi:hypothetical protein
MIGDPQAREVWALTARADRDGDIGASLDHADTLRRQQEVEAVTAQLEALKTSALDDEDETSRTKAIDAGNSLIFGLRGTGALDEAQARAMREGWVENYVQGRLSRLPPDERIRLLQQGEGGIAEFILEDNRPELIRVALADRLDMERKAQSDADLAPARDLRCGRQAGCGDPRVAAG